MTTTRDIEIRLTQQTLAGQVEMAELESQMLAHLLDGNTRQAILTYHDAMVADVNEAKAVVAVLANVYGVRYRRV